MTALHLLDPARAGLDEAVGFAFGAVIDNEMVGETVDHPARAMGGVKYFRGTHFGRTVVDNDPFPLARLDGITDDALPADAEHDHHQQQRFIRFRPPHTGSTHQPALSEFALSAPRYRFPFRGL